MAQQAWGRTRGPEELSPSTGLVGQGEERVPPLVGDSARPWRPGREGVGVTKTLASQSTPPSPDHASCSSTPSSARGPHGCHPYGVPEGGAWVWRGRQELPGREGWATSGTQNSRNGACVCDVLGKDVLPITFRLFLSVRRNPFT